MVYMDHKNVYNTNEGRATKCFNWHKSDSFSWIVAPVWWKLHLYQNNYVKYDKDSQEKNGVHM